MGPVVAVAVFGAAGSVFRYWIQEWISAGDTTRLPLATLLVNGIGCLLIGIFYWMCETHGVERTLRVGMMAGLLGGFTTFSGFALDGLRLLQAGAIGTCITLVVLQNVLGLVCVALGYRLPHWFGIG